MSVKFSNNAVTTLSAGISAGATSFTVASASTFPTLASGDWTYVSLTSEVVKVTAISGTTFTCDATSAAHASGESVELRMTSELLNDFAEDTEALPLAGGTMTGDVLLGDNVKAKFGASNDLQIYHNGSNSFIQENGTGNLTIRGSNLSLADSSGNSYAYFSDTGTGGTSTFYHNGSAKLSTTSTGIDVTGRAILGTSSVGIDNTAPTALILRHESDQTTGFDDNFGVGMKFNADARNGGYATHAELLATQKSTGYQLRFKVGGTERLNLDSTGGFVTTPAVGGHAVFNEAGIDADFRVESDTNANALFVNGANGHVDLGGVRSGGVATHSVVASSLGALGTTLGDTEKVFGLHSVTQNHDYLTFRTRRITEGNSGWNHSVWDITRDVDNSNEIFLYQTFGMNVNVFNENGANLDFRVESIAHTHALFVDGGNNVVGIDQSSPTYLLDVGNGTSSPSNGNVMRINSAGDAIFSLSKANTSLFSMRNNSTSYTALCSNSSADLLLGYSTLGAGAISDHLRFRATSTVVNEDGQDRDFRVESDTNANMLFVDAGNDQVNIGGNIPERGVLSIKAPSGSGNKANILLRQETYGTGAFTPQYSYKTGYVDSTGNGTLLTIPFFARSYNQTGYFKITVMGSQYNLSNRATVGVAEFALNLAYPSNIQPLELSGVGNYASVAGNTSGQLLITFSNTYNASTFDGLFYNIEFYAQQGDAGNIDYANITLT